MIILSNPKNTRRAIEHGADPQKLAEIENINKILQQSHLET